MEKEIEEKINKLSMMEQNTQYLSSQRQNFQTQLVELESALDELSTASDSYRIIGTIMVKVSKDKIKSELTSKKGLVEARIKSIEKQEDSMKEKAKELRDEVMAGFDSQEKAAKVKKGD
jgi:prefoldin beta subunit